MVVCVHIPRFELRVAAGGSRSCWGGRSRSRRAVAVRCRSAKSPPSAQAQGVRAGMALGEALGRCRQLELIPGDPIKVARAWEQSRAGTGRDRRAAGARPPGPCVLRRGWAGRDPRRRDGVIAAAGKALRRPPRIGVGPTRFGALAAGAGSALASRAG